MLKGYIEYNKLEKIVLNKLKDIGITEKDYPLNPFELIEREKIILQEIDYDETDIRGMIVFGNNVTGISINKNRTYKSKVYIAMHELSHFWFHPHNTEYICVNDYIERNSDKEWQANNAASLALMPTNILKKLFCESGGNLECISDYFNVGISAVRYRLQKLQMSQNDIISYGQNIDLRTFAEKTYAEHLLYGTK
nr:MAG TPA: IrrE protein [Bacteriophage sp.]